MCSYSLNLDNNKPYKTLPPKPLSSKLIKLGNLNTLKTSTLLKMNIDSVNSKLTTYSLKNITLLTNL